MRESSPGCRFAPSRLRVLRRSAVRLPPPYPPPQAGEGRRCSASGGRRGLSAAPASRAVARAASEGGSLRQHLAPDALPVLAGRVGDAAVALEEPVGDL